MSTTAVSPDENPRRRRVTYIVVGLILVVLLVIMLIAYTGHKESTQATEKAQQLSAAITAAGFRSPEIEDIVRVLGDDGGAVCAAPPGSLTEATLKGTMTNGAAGPGMRAVQVSRIVVGGERLIIQTYCPENLAAFDEFISSLSFADVVSQ
jgi:hypothetical protein